MANDGSVEAAVQRWNNAPRKGPPEPVYIGVDLAAEALSKPIARRGDPLSFRVAPPRRRKWSD